MRWEKKMEFFSPISFTKIMSYHDLSRHLWGESEDVRIMDHSQHDIEETPPSAPTPALAEKQGQGSFRSVLSNRPFVALWLAQLFSQIAFNAANYGVITTVTAITNSATMAGIAIICFTLPAVPFSLLAGVYVDYLDKRLVLWLSNALRAVASLLIVLALIWNPHTV